MQILQERRHVRHVYLWNIKSLGGSPLMLPQVPTIFCNIPITRRIEDIGIATGSNSIICSSGYCIHQFSTIAELNVCSSTNEASKFSLSLIYLYHSFPVNHFYICNSYKHFQIINTVMYSPYILWSTKISRNTIYLVSFVI